MSDEPLYCTRCGREWGVEDHAPSCDQEARDAAAQAADPNDWAAEDGPYCHTCGVHGAVEGLCARCKEMFEKYR